MPHPLDELNVSDHPLSQSEKDFMDTNGYLSLGQLLSPSLLNALRKRIDELTKQEGDNGGSELYDSKHIRHPKETGVHRLANLANKGSIFDTLYTHPKLLATVRHTLGTEFKLSSLNFRAAKPNQGLQKLHVDWHEAVSPGAYRVCNSIWLLDDFSVANGATRLVPGTHLCGKAPEEEMEDPLQSHPQEIILEAPAGTAVVFNSHVWHGGTTNQTEQPRRAIHSYFCHRDEPQQTPQQKFIQQDTLDRISNAARWLLNV